MASFTKADRASGPLIGLCDLNRAVGDRELIDKKRLQHRHGFSALRALLLCHKIRRRVRCWQQGHLDMLRAMARANDESEGW